MKLHNISLTTFLFTAVILLCVIITMLWISQQEQKDLLNEGGRYTQEEHDTYAKEIEVRIKRLESFHANTTPAFIID